MDRFFRMRVFFVFVVLSLISGLLAFTSATKSVAKTGQTPVIRIGAEVPA
jgi:hypothetical protein